MSPHGARLTLWSAFSAPKAAKNTPSPNSASCLFSEGFLVHHIGHFGKIAAVVPFQHVNQALSTTSSHALVWIGREPRDFARAGKVWKQTAAVFDCWIAKGRVNRQWFFFVNIKRGATNPVFA